MGEADGERWREVGELDHKKEGGKFIHAHRAQFVTEKPDKTSRSREHDRLTLTRVVVIFLSFIHAHAFEFKFMIRSEVQRLGVSNGSGKNLGVVRGESIANSDRRISGVVTMYCIC